MRYEASAVIAMLEGRGCVCERDLGAVGMFWISREGHVFQLPQPFKSRDGEWFDADVIEAILAERWLERCNLPKIK